ncbi:MAG: MATE family efflux transporter [Chloroflexota bacterium]
MNTELLKQVWRLALPVMLTNLLQSLVDVVDVYMVGRLGPIAIAAVGMSTTIRMLVLVMLLAVSAGAMPLVAQARGGRDPKRMSFVTRQAISSGVLLSIVLLLSGLILAEPLLSLINQGGDEEAVVMGTLYLQLLFLGTPFMVLNMVCNRLMQAAGDTVTPLILTIAINVINILLNYLFIFGVGPIPTMGLTGAALGTVIARGLGAVAVLILFYSGKNIIKILPGTYRPHWQTFSDIFTIGLPSGLQGVFRNGSRLLVFGLVTSTEIATFGVAALSIGMQVESLAFMPVLGINVAATSLVGNAIGSWQTEEARQRGSMAIGLGVVVMIVLATPIVIFAPAIIRLFDPSAHPTVMSAGTAYMRINTVLLPFVGIAMVANGALRGAGDTMPGMVSTLLTKGAITVILAYFFAFPLGMGSIGIWYGLAIGSVLDGFLMLGRWLTNVWLKVALHKTELYRRHLRHLNDYMQQEFLREVRTPLMAIPTATETVLKNEVVYTKNDSNHKVTVLFGRDGYWVEH